MPQLENVLCPNLNDQKIINHYSRHRRAAGTRMLLWTSIDGFSKPLDVRVADLRASSVQVEITSYTNLIQFLHHFQRETMGFHRNIINHEGDLMAISWD